MVHNLFDLMPIPNDLTRFLVPIDQRVHSGASISPEVHYDEEGSLPQQPPAPQPRLSFDDVHSADPATVTAITEAPVDDKATRVPTTPLDSTNTQSAGDHGGWPAVTNDKEFRGNFPSFQALPERPPQAIGGAGSNIGSGVGNYVVGSEIKG